jgi:hypothetical protein
MNGPEISDWITRSRAVKMTGLEVLGALVKIHKTRDKILIQKFLDNPERYGDPLLFEMEATLPQLTDDEYGKARDEILNRYKKETK